jgi:hypothetical protein
MAEWTPFQTHCYSENLVAPGIEPGTSGSAARNSDHYTTEAVLLTLTLSLSHTTNNNNNNNKAAVPGIMLL